MKYLSILAFSVLAAACNSCAPQPAPVPPAPAPAPTFIADAAPAPTDAAPAPDDEDAASRKATPATACASMHAAGCDEAESVSACTSVVAHAISAKITKVDLTCLTGAKTAAAVRKCGFVSCGGAP